MRKEHLAIAVLVVALAVVVFRPDGRAEPVMQASASAKPYVHAESAEAAGRYLVIVGGCNDCHTAGWDETGGQVPETQWLLGKNVGFHGPWGTSYPGNVRRYLANMTEDAWVEFAQRWEARPPMPAMNVHRMNEQDLRAIYRYVRTLEPVGEATPRPLPPGATPTTPYLDFHLQNLPEAPAGE